MPKKLLLADDSVVIQKLVGLSFANEDIEIVATDNGDDAVTTAREIRPDVVLADVVMPGKSGYEVCEAIKQDPDLQRTPVLLLTGTFEAFDEGRAESVGADGQITKPFEAQALVERVNAVMNAPPRPAPSAAAPSTPTISRPDTSRPDTSRPDTSEQLFAANDGRLAADLSEGMDVTPTLDATGPDTTASGLFGAPGEAAVEEPVEAVGEMVIGQSVAPARDETPSAPAATSAAATPPGATRDAAPPPIPPAGEPRAAASPLPPARPLTDPATFAAEPPPVPPVAAKSDPTPVAPVSPAPTALDPTDLDPTDLDPSDAGEPDPVLDGLEPPSLAEPVPAAETVDLDSALDAVTPAEEATILVGDRDRNASTSRNLSDGIPSGADSQRDDSGFEDLTVHVPSADIDQDRAAAPSPDLETPDTSYPGRPDVANLDETLGSSPRTAAEPPPSPTPRRRATDFATPSSPASDTADSLDLAPSALPSIGADDVDFAFDVSEQRPVDRDPHEDSFSSLMDISESQILGGRREATPVAPASPEDAEADLADERILAGYDVSSSEILPGDTTGGMPPTESASAAPPPVAESMPEPEPLIEVPDLPDAYQPSATAADGAPAAPRRRDAFEELETGSPFEALPLSPEDDVRDATLETDADEAIADPAPEEILVGTRNAITAEETIVARADAFEGANDLEGTDDLEGADDLEIAADFERAGALEIDDEDEHEETSEEAEDDFTASIAIGPAIPADDDTRPPIATRSATPIATADDEDEEASVSADDDEATEIGDARPISAGATPSARATPSAVAKPSALATPSAAEADRRVPDLSPLMEQQIQETLEKVAWEAFSDLSETIVKQVMTRVESIAWEVIPEMAETLVREEIRRMKGEDED